MNYFCRQAGRLCCREYCPELPNRYNPLNTESSITVWYRKHPRINKYFRNNQNGVLNVLLRYCILAVIPLQNSVLPFPLASKNMSGEKTFVSQQTFIQPKLSMLFSMTENVTVENLQSWIFSTSIDIQHLGSKNQTSSSPCKQQVNKFTTKLNQSIAKNCVLTFVIVSNLAKNCVLTFVIVSNLVHESFRRVGATN